MGKWLNGLTGVLWLAAVALVPLAFNPYSRRVFEPEKAFVLLSISALLAVILVVRGSWLSWSWSQACAAFSVRQPRVLVAVSLALLTLWVWLTAVITSIAPLTSIQGSYEWRQGALSFSACVVLFVSIAWSDQIRRWQTALLTTAEVTSVAVAGYGILQSLQLDPLPWHRAMEGRAFSTLGHPNFLASYLILTIALAGSRTFAARNLKEQLIHGCVCAVSLACMLLTFSRSGWLGLSAAAGFIILVQIVRSPQRKWWLALAATLVVLAGVLALAAYADPRGVFSYSALEPLHSFLRGKSATTQVRSLTWHGVWELIRQRTWQGFGPETFRLAFPRAYPPLLTVYGGLVAAGDHAHNAVLDIALSSGVIGVALYAWFLLSVLWTGLRSIAGTVRAEQRALQLGLIAGVIGYTVQNQLSFATIAPMTLFWVFLGLITVPVQRAVVPGPPVAAIGRTGAWRRWLAGAVAAAVGTAVLIVVVLPLGRALTADVFARQGQDAAALGDWAGSVTEYERALTLAPAQDRYWQNLGDSYAALALSAPEARAERFSAAVDALAHAIALSPDDVTHQSALATVYYEWGVSGRSEQLDLAADAFRAAVEVSPTDPQLWARWGRVLQAQGRFEEALEKYQRALDLDPFYVPAYSYQGETYLALQRVADAQAAFARIDAVSTELDRMVSKR